MFYRFENAEAIHLRLSPLGSKQESDGNYVQTRENPGDPSVNRKTGWTRKGWDGWIWTRTFFRNNEKNRWGRGYFEFNEPKPSSSQEELNTPEENTIETEPVSNTEESEVAESLSNFPIVDFKKFHIAEKTVHYIQINHVINKPKTKSAEAEENLKKAEFNFMIDLRTLINKISVEPKLIQLKISARNNQKDSAPEDFASVFSENTELFGLLFAGDRIVIPHELQRPVLDALHFGWPGSTKMLADSRIFWWPGLKKDIQNRCSTWVPVRT